MSLPMTMAIRPRALKTDFVATPRVNMVKRCRMALSKCLLLNVSSAFASSYLKT